MPSIGRITRRHSPGWAASLAPSYAPELNLCGSEVRGDEGIHRLHQRWFRFIERRKRGRCEAPAVSHGFADPVTGRVDVPECPKYDEQRVVVPLNLGRLVWYRGILYRQHMEPEETPNASHLVGIRFVQVHPGEDIRILLECLGGRRETDRHLAPAPISIYATLDDHLSRSTFRTSRSIGGDRSAPMTAYATVICCASKAT